MGDICVVCRRRRPLRGHVCDSDRLRIHDQLTDLPRKMAALRVHLVPTAAAAPAGVRVSTSRTGSPANTRLDALNLVGPGSDGLSPQAVAAMLYPRVRKWRTTHTVTVTVDTPDGPHTEDREVVTWEQELVRDRDGHPVHAVADDQVGLFPPADWLDSWARTWRQHFGHHNRSTNTNTSTIDNDRPRRRTMDRQYAVNAVLGMRPGYGGNVPADQRVPDPVREEWEIRWGEPESGVGLRADVRYLLARLVDACEQDVGIADFASELRALTAELTRVLGERPDQQWLGRCPAGLTDRDTGLSRPCGAGLWQDPFASQVVCPRCRSTWGPGKVALLHLAKAIRRTWPIDRRRRYTLTEITGIGAVRALRCPACGCTAEITWREVTAAGDRSRSWRPEQVTCPSGCPDVGRLI